MTYESISCKCGLTHEDNPLESSESYSLKLATIMGNPLYKKVRRCKKCKEILMQKRVAPSKQ